MTVEEIFSQVAQHMIEGLMTHSQLCDYFNFLGLKGFAKCHEYHYFCENGDYKEIAWYYMEHYNKLLLDLPFKNPGVIPENWFNYTRQQVDAATRHNFIQVGLEKWVKWEQETKALYEKMYNELCGMGEVAAALALSKYITSVDEELAEAREKLLCYK